MRMAVWRTNSGAPCCFLVMSAAKWLTATSFHREFMTSLCLRYVARAARERATSCGQANSKPLILIMSEILAHPWPRYCRVAQEQKLFELCLAFTGTSVTISDLIYTEAYADFFCDKGFQQHVKVCISCAVRGMRTATINSIGDLIIFGWR